MDRVDRIFWGAGEIGSGPTRLRSVSAVISSIVARAPSLAAGRAVRIQQLTGAHPFPARLRARRKLNALLDNPPYDTFAQSGRLVVTEGNAIDQDRIIADLVALAGELDVREMAVDRWGAVGFLTRLQGARLPR